ncbi:EamA family transporter RarD [Thalassobius vesicularis]|uniref:EamA family transporter RarD n=1 Tax=Thalassobius vesicularis TaxID=1294297 RepID=A0A4S3MEL9_9RHOB|nr:EamA family transporter RarD [Thalassobius vesicularis]THD76588.1 EamA family transporter RarD [Thalassobius vesicularis]
MTNQTADSPRGLAFALAAYFMWGFLPLYLKAMAHIPPAEVVAHRILWSVPVAGLLLVALGRTRDLSAALRSPKMLAMASLTAGLITINWGTYVWAIGAGRTLDAALGYYINPLFSVLLGAVLLGERLNATQMVSVALAGCAVGVLWYDAGSLPWPALVLMVSWGFYAYFKKSLPIGPNQGFLLEVLILSVPSLGYLIWLSPEGAFGGDVQDTVLLVGAGIVTAVPLIVYANGAKLLRLSTIAILQYIAPTMIFLTAVFVFDEPFGQARMIAFPMIWAALVVYTVPMVRQMRNGRART